MKLDGGERETRDAVKNRLRDKNARGHDSKESSSRVFSTAASRSRSKQSPPVITLLTDFGAADYFVGAMKGAILSENPEATIVDISHDIPPQDIGTAAFTLLAAHSSFPSGTIHVAVVDPGVGSSRRPILIQTRNQLFVGPDNGIFSYVYDLPAKEKSPEIFHLTNTKYFRHPVSPTFNGRDVFAPVAGALSRGMKPTSLGKRTSEFVRLSPLQPASTRDGQIIARIIHIDRFGNCVTNISQTELTNEMIASGAQLRLKGRRLKSFRSFFSEETGSREKVFGFWGSAGFLEIAAANDSAAKLLHAKRGDSVIVSGV